MALSLPPRIHDGWRVDSPGDARAVILWGRPPASGEPPLTSVPVGNRPAFPRVVRPVGETVPGFVFTVGRLQPATATRCFGANHSRSARRHDTGRSVATHGGPDLRHRFAASNP